MRYFILMIAVAFLVTGIGYDSTRGNTGDASLRLVALLAAHERRRRNPEVSVSSLMAIQSWPDKSPGGSYRYNN